MQLGSNAECIIMLNLFPAVTRVTHLDGTKMTNQLLTYSLLAALAVIIRGDSDRMPEAVSGAVSASSSSVGISTAACTYMQCQASIDCANKAFFDRGRRGAGGGSDGGGGGTADAATSNTEAPSSSAGSSSAVKTVDEGNGSAVDASEGVKQPQCELSGAEVRFHNNHTLVCGSPRTCGAPTNTPQAGQSAKVPTCPPSCVCFC
jgi:hypothetical protein